MSQFRNRITIFLWLLVLIDIVKSITCTAIGDTWQDVVSGTKAHDGEYDMHEGFPCDGWGVSADYSVSFDWKMDEMPADGGYWHNILHIGKNKKVYVLLSFNLCNAYVHPTPHRHEGRQEIPRSFSKQIWRVSLVIWLPL